MAYYPGPKWARVKRSGDVTLGEAQDMIDRAKALSGDRTEDHNYKAPTGDLTDEVDD